jgi:3-hydroxy-3-methylglutaryl CoA synthase/uncharacterized OB-fold protein
MPIAPVRIRAYAAYLPHHRLVLADAAPDAAIASRTVAAYDEDATTLGVEAARRALRASRAQPGAVLFATTAPPYVDKTNATAVHAALDLAPTAFAADMGAAPRGAVAAMLAAASAPSDGLAVLADVRVGRPGSIDEAAGADAAAAFVLGDGSPAGAELVATASATAEFLDRWRAPGDVGARLWEERFGAAAYAPLVRDAAARALAAAGLDEPDHVVVSCAHARAADAARRAVPGRRPAPPLPLGYAGAADAGVRLADALDRARPDETILLVSAADGCDALVFRTTEQIAAIRPATAVRAQFDGGRPVAYATYLTWRGLLEREGPRRPRPDQPAPPATQRAEAWKFAFVGSLCECCGRIHLPPRRVCVGCGASDRMRPHPMAEARGRIATLAVDRQAYSPSPPLTTAVIDFEPSARCALELADAPAGTADIGSRVALTFRRLYTADGIHNYFWKARPITNEEG